MRKWVTILVSLFSIPFAAKSQDVQVSQSLDSRVAYTTNTYLNPILSEWNQSGNTGYVLLSPIGQIAYSHNRFSTSFTTGALYEPFFDGREAWSGGFILTNTRYRISHKLALGLESGGSHFSTTTDRSLFWVQPVLTWSPSLFTQFRFKAGSTFIQFTEFIEEEQNRATTRFDSYAIEFETWPDMNWQLRGGIYGNLDDPTGMISFRAAADRMVNRKLKFTMNAGLEQYRFQVLTEGGGGTPPIGGPSQNGNQLIKEEDRILRTGLGASYQFNKSFSANLNTDALKYFSFTGANTPIDMQISAGFRYSIFPSFGKGKKADAHWRMNSTQIVTLKLNYSGDGQLFILGDFNNWDQPGIPLARKAKNQYTTQLSLNAGAYEYKILLIEGSEEKWLDFTDDVYTIPDGFGGKNAMIFID